MMPHPQAPRHAPISKIDRWIVGFFTLAAFGYSVSYVMEYLYIHNIAFETTTGLFAAFISLKALIVPASRHSHRGRATVLISVLFAVALFNMLVSQDVVQTSMRWILWFWIVIALNRVVGAADGSWIPMLIKRLPWLFLAVYVTLILVARNVKDEQSIRFSLHLSGLYGNLMFACGLFAAKWWQRLSWSVGGMLAIYFSGAGGALFTVPIMFIPFILYSASSMPVKGIGVAMLIIMGGAFFFQSQLFGRFLDIKLNASYDNNSVNGLERLERSRDMRLQLINYGLQKVIERPVGTGLGHTYADELSRIYMVSHVHNGTITMLVELGLPGFAVVAGLMAWVMWSILRSSLIGNQLKGFYFTYFFTMFGRSLSENYTPFDLGNLFNFIFLLFTISLFLHERAQQRPLPVMAPPPPWPMRGPPHLPMPRSMAVR